MCFVSGTSKDCQRIKINRQNQSDRKNNAYNNFKSLLNLLLKEHFFGWKTDEIAPCLSVNDNDNSVKSCLSFKDNE